MLLSKAYKATIARFPKLVLLLVLPCLTAEGALHLGSHGLASVPQPQSFGQRAKLKAEEACREEAQGLCKCSGPEYTLGQHCYGISTGACSGRISPNAMPWSAWVTTGIVKFTAHVQTVFYGVPVFIHFLTIKTVWPSGLRRWLKAPFRKSVGSNPTAVNVLAGGVTTRHQ